MLLKELGEFKTSLYRYLKEISPIHWKYNTVFVHKDTGEQLTLQELFRLIPKALSDPRAEEWFKVDKIKEIEGGLAKQKGLTKDKVDPKEFAIGMKVEKEHTNDIHRLEQTVLDHLAENPHYYTLLKKAKLEGAEMKNNKIQREAVTLLKKLVREQVMSYYSKEAEKNIKKNEKPKKLEKERMAKEEGYSGSDEKKQEFVHELLELTNEFNTTTMTKEDFLKELAELGKIVGAKKQTIEENFEKFIGKWNKDTDRKIYVYEVAQMMLETPHEDSTSSTFEPPSAEKKNDPEQAKKVTDEIREKGKEETKETKKMKDTLGKTEAAPSKPKGIGSLNNKTVKTMKEEKPTRFKSFLTGKKK